MKNIYIKAILLLCSLNILASCSPDEDDPDTQLTGLGGETWVKGPVDTWLYDNLVVPYNIEVKYRFDRYEVNLGKTLSPPREDKVIPAMEAIKKTWIEPYEQIAGPTFIKRLSPKQFVLVGSAEYNPNGTITLGTAEGGRKIVLYVINDFDKSNKPVVKEMLHTIHHEFGHILHQTVMYPEEYKRITPTYTASWNDFTLADAQSRGYISQYSRSNPSDDFVEMIAFMLVEGRAGFNAMVNGIGYLDPNDPSKFIPGSVNTEAQATLRRKEQIIVRYFKESWNIDIYALQARAETAINSL